MKIWITVIVIILSAGHYSLFFAGTPKKSWVVMSIPTKSKITRIIAFNNGKAIASSNKLYFYNSREWQEFPVQPPVSEISRIFALNENYIWVSQNNLNNESDFYQYKNNNWQKHNYPLVNGIQDFNLDYDGTGWFFGDREIAYQRSVTHAYISYPPTPDPVIKSYCADKGNIWINTGSQGFFYFNGSSWSEPFPGKKIQCFFFTNRNNGYCVSGKYLYRYKNGKWSLHSEYELLKNIRSIVYSGGEFWGIGSEGLLLHYTNTWNKVQLPVKNDLYDITFTNEGTGWIAGDKGTILKYTDEKPEKIISQPGFDRSRLLYVAKQISDEYGVVMEDFDNNGYPDVYATCLFEPSHLFLNKSEINNIIFTEEAFTRNVTGRSGDKRKVSFSNLYLGAGSADIDNDGDQDLYLCNLGFENKMLLNDGGAYFRDVSNQLERATEKNERTNSAVFSDVDGDGDLDLFIANEYSTNRLYLNNGYGYFKEVTEKAGLTTPYGGMGAVFSDIDNDGDPDLFVVNWSVPNILYENISTSDDGVKFRNISKKSGFDADSIKKSNAAVFADYDNDGDPDLYVTNRRLSNRLYRNEGNGLFTDVTYHTTGYDSMYSYGANFADFDNDGYQDLFVANVGENKLYKNYYGRKFVDVTSKYGAELGGYSTGSACGDIDNDGDIDLYVANYIDANSLLFINNINNNNYLKIEVEGKLSNRDAVGVKVKIYTSGNAEKKEHLKGYKEISGGSGYSSKDSRLVHFGVKEGYYDIVITFPASGIEKILTHVHSGTFIKVSEFDGFYSGFYSGLNMFKRFLYNRENQEEMTKFILVLFLVGGSFIYGIKKYGWRKEYFAVFALPVLAAYLLQIGFLRYEELIYSTIIPIASVLFIITAVHIFFERNLMRERVNDEKQKTRDQLARDLHDDLASTISSALIYTDLVQDPELTEKSQNLLSKVRNLLKDAAGAITDIIWTASPRHDNIEDLVTRLQLLMNDLCRINSIEFKSNLNINDYDLEVTDEVRRNIYLIFKEAINNVIKHSSATKVEFSVSLSDNELNFSLFDNGIGFDESRETDILKNQGHGLRNLKARAYEIDADLKISSGSNKGTVVQLKQKIS